MAVMPESFGQHPILACAEQVGTELAEIADVPVELMSAAEWWTERMPCECDCLPRPTTSLPMPVLVTQEPGSRTPPAASDAICSATSTSARPWPSAGTASPTVWRTAQ